MIASESATFGNEDHLIWSLPTKRTGKIVLPYKKQICQPAGPTQYNGSILCVDETTPSLFYKFIPWDRCALANNEIDIYSALAGLAGELRIVRLVGVSGTEEHLVRVFERSRMGSIGRFLFKETQGDHRRTDPDLIWSLLAQTAEAMSCIHERDVVHRDLKAENILMFEEDADGSDPRRVRAKIADFDRAIELKRGDRLEEPVGSLLHMAPELFLREKYDRKIDVYAFGVVMHEIAHGGSRAHAHVANAMPESISKDEFVRRVIEDELRPNWRHEDETLKILAARCWSADPRERPEFSEIADILKRGRASAPALRSGGVGDRTPPLPSETPGIGVASDIGLVRKTMEDAACVLCASDLLVAAVFDGLSGARASELSARRLALALASRLSGNDEPEAAISCAFASMDEVLRRARPPIEAGSTAVVALLRENDLTLSWVGDSPACLFRRSAAGEPFEAVELVNRHHPSRADEAVRVVANGGSVRQRETVLDSGETVPWGPLRVFTPANGAERGVAITRALGLFSCKPAVGAEPEIVRLARREEDLFLVLGSDGVFDLLDVATIFGVVEAAASPQRAADAIVAAAIQKGAPDNATVVVVDMRP